MDNLQLRYSAVYYDIVRNSYFVDTKDIPDWGEFMLKLLNLDKPISRTPKSYLIKNKNDTLAIVEFDSKRNVVSVTGELPQLIRNNVRGWFESRTPPKHRAHMKELMEQMGATDFTDILDFSKGLSLNDNFWVCPEGDNLDWNEINLFDNEFDETIARIAFTGGLYGIQFSTTSPEFATNGMLPKCWVRDSSGVINLIKAGTDGFSNTGWEPYCEVMATQILCRLKYKHVPYKLVNFHGKKASSCPLLTSKKLSMAPSFLLLSFDNFQGMVSSCVEEGFGKQLAEYLIFDFLTCNPDRHAGNISVLFNPDTYEPLGLSPIYDNGMSCLCYIGRDDTWKDYYRTLGPSLYDTFEEGAMVGKYFRKNDHNVESLIGFKFDRRELGDMPESRVQMVEEFLQLRVQQFFDLNI